MTRKFSSTENYVATEDLSLAVNAAITLGRPLLIKGEPGTGKTQLAEEVASSLSAPLYRWHVKSTTKAQQGLYEYDAVSRLRDSQLGEDKVHDIANYIIKGKLWEAFEEERPLVIITSNNEKELPDAFLRRCFFHYIKFPDKETMEQIVGVHYPSIKKNLLDAALNAFFSIREVQGITKKPSTSELLDWLKLLLAEDIPADALHADDSGSIIPKLHGALLKNEQDVHLFERLVFLNKRKQQ